MTASSWRRRRREREAPGRRRRVPQADDASLTESAWPARTFRLRRMDWEVTPEPHDDAEREVLVQAADDVVDGDRQSVWWSSGLEDLGGLEETTAMPWGRAARPEDGVLSHVRI